MKMPKPREPWEAYPPTEEDKKRIKRYEDAYKILKGDHGSVFGLISDVAPEDYKVINFCSLFSKACADLLFGEDIKIKSLSGNKAVDDALLAIADRSNLQTVLWESAFSSVGRGDAVLKVNFVEGVGAVIKSVPPKYFFPHLADDDAKTLEAATLAFLQKDNSGKSVLFREIHEKGRITTDYCDWNSSRREFVVDESKSCDTGFDGLLVFHIPNFSTDEDFWGISDYDALLPSQRALNSSVTRLDAVLDKYSDPLLAVPEGTLKSLEDSIHSGDAKELMIALQMQMDFMYNKRRSQVFEGSPDALGNLPRYVEWNADLSSRLAQINLTVEHLMMLSETSPALFGIDRNGYPESGKAMRFRFFRTLAMINRKTQFWDKALKDALFASLTLENKYMNGVTPERPALTWGDGLPEDEQEKILMATTKKSAGLASLKRVVGEANSIEGEELDAEILAIKSDETEQDKRSGVGEIE